LGTKVVVSGGLVLASVALLSFAGLDATSSYFPDVAWRLVLLAAGMACTMAPATESIMGSLPLAKAGVGSAVNDTTRQVGGALGVAVIGSVVASTYGNQVSEFLRGKNVPTGEVDKITQQLGAALAAGRDVPGLVTTAVDAFVDGMHLGVVVAGCVALVGALVTLIFLPARARDETAADLVGATGDVVVPAVAGDAGQPAVRA
jgi:hypothetical protein